MKMDSMAILFGGDEMATNIEHHSHVPAATMPGVLGVESRIGVMFHLSIAF